MIFAHCTVSSSVILSFVFAFSLAFSISISFTIPLSFSFTCRIGHCGCSWWWRCCCWGWSCQLVIIEALDCAHSPSSSLRFPARNEVHLHLLLLAGDIGTWALAIFLSISNHLISSFTVIHIEFSARKVDILTLLLSSGCSLDSDQAFNLLAILIARLSDQGEAAPF